MLRMWAKNVKKSSLEAAAAVGSNLYAQSDVDAFIKSLLLLSFSLFTAAEIEQLRHLTLWDVIVNATSINPDEIQRNVFFWLSADPCPQPKQLNASDMPRCEFLRGHDSFQVRERGRE